MMENMLIQSQNMSEFNTPEVPASTNEQKMITMPVPYFQYPPYPFHPESPWIYMVPYMPPYTQSPSFQQFASLLRHQGADIIEQPRRRSLPFNKIDPKTMKVTKNTVHSIQSVPKAQNNEPKIAEKIKDSPPPAEKTTQVKTVKRVVEVLNPTEVNKVGDSQEPMSDESMVMKRHWKKNMLVADEAFKVAKKSDRKKSSKSRVKKAVPGRKKNKKSLTFSTTSPPASI